MRVIGGGGSLFGRSLLEWSAGSSFDYYQYDSYRDEVSRCYLVPNYRLERLFGVIGSFVPEYCHCVGFLQILLVVRCYGNYLKNN